MVNHMTMARKEVLVQLDETLVEQLDTMASQLGTNRSALLRSAAAALITAHEERLADEAMRLAYRDAPQDPIFIQAALQLARENTPPW